MEVSRTQEELPARRPWRNIRTRGRDILGSLVGGNKRVEDKRIDEIRAGWGIVVPEAISTGDDISEQQLVLKGKTEGG